MLSDPAYVFTWGFVCSRMTCVVPERYPDEKRISVGGIHQKSNRANLMSTEKGVI